MGTWPIAVVGELLAKPGPLAALHTASPCEMCEQNYGEAIVCPFTIDGNALMCIPTSVIEAPQLSQRMNNGPRSGRT